ncbi:MAG: hypothetical protein A3C53_08165 [Omnitrophica WOR_2 bacterium RIFCSPHIGHO2_02_FULL_68_15]|nr:MAG: hypothetical protein A3C53_08165 [Omnitrophica WOR_2 bacterium RIFCSPHIGHO2_02_FULL_68_15]
MAEALRSAATPNVGLEEDVSRFALPPGFSSSLLRLSKGNQNFETLIAQRIAHHERAIGFLSASPVDYLSASVKFQTAATEWNWLGKLLGSVSTPVPSSAKDLVREAVQKAYAGQAYATARQAAVEFGGPGVRMEYYRSLTDNAQSYPDTAIMLGAEPSPDDTLILDT